METFEKFKQRNAAFGAYDIPKLHEEEMLKCYAIANQVAEDYQRNYGHIEGPRIGDIVEFADEYRVYKHGKIVENLYGGSKYGMLCVCENGSSHTDGKGFSTSGGAFKAIHRSKLQYAGEAENVVWTWGCYGSGAHQGIYFPLKVQKWIIPYEQPVCRSMVTIRGRGCKSCDGHTLAAVSIKNCGAWFNVESFCSIGAFKAWAKYVGYEYGNWRGTFEKMSRIRIEDKCYTDKNWQPPKGAKPIKIIRNGDVKDGWVLNTGDTILYLWPNIYDPNEKHPEYGTPEYKAASDGRLRLFLKYQGNPLGVPET